MTLGKILLCMFIVQVLQETELSVDMIAFGDKMVLKGHAPMTVGNTVSHIHCSGLEETEPFS